MWQTKVGQRQRKKATKQDWENFIQEEQNAAKVSGYSETMWDQGWINIHLVVIPATCKASNGEVDTISSHFGGTTSTLLLWTWMAGVTQVPV